MNNPQTSGSAKRHFCLMPAHSAKRWGRWFLFAWIAMSLSTALLPCREVLAAVAASKTALHAVCGQPAKQAPDSGGDRKTKSCLNLAAPARAPLERLASPTSGTLIHHPATVSAPALVSFPPLVLVLRQAFRAAPPPVAAYLRNSRLLI